MSGTALAPERPEPPVRPGRARRGRHGITRGVHRRLDLARARQSVVLLVLARILAIVVLFLLLNEAYRSAEIEISVWFLNLFSSPDVAQALGGSKVLLLPENRPAFIGIITPSCSAASSIFVLLILGTLLPSYLPRRRTAVLVAVAVVAVGNLIRIVSVLGVGLAYGRSALVLFHDWAGSVFTFGYTVAGFLLMLYIMLPKNAPEDD